MVLEFLYKISCIYKRVPHLGYLTLNEGFCLGISNKAVTIGCLT